MIEVADILRLHGPAYRAAHCLLPSQQKVLEDLVRCRTPACGGHLWQCDLQDCGYQQYSYHSCGNRHCPKCHGQQTQRWLEQQRERLLPCAYYFVTFTDDHSHHLTLFLMESCDEFADKFNTYANILKLQHGRAAHHRRRRADAATQPDTEFRRNSHSSSGHSSGQQHGAGSFASTTAGFTN